MCGMYQAQLPQVMPLFVAVKGKATGTPPCFSGGSPLEKDKKPCRAECGTIDPAGPAHLARLLRAFEPWTWEPAGLSLGRKQINPFVALCSWPFSSQEGSHFLFFRLLRLPSFFPGVIRRQMVRTPDFGAVFQAKPFLSPFDLVILGIWLLHWIFCGPLYSSGPQSTASVLFGGLHKSIILFPVLVPLFLLFDIVVVVLPISFLLVLICSSFFLRSFPPQHKNQQGVPFCLLFVSL